MKSDSDDDGEPFAPIVVKWRSLDDERTAPRGREGHVFVPYGRSLYVHGGSSAGQDGLLFGCLHKYDLENGTWTHLACTGEIPPPREGHTAFIWRHQLYILGGCTEKEDMFDVYSCDLSTHRWTRVPCSESPAVASPKGFNVAVGDSVGSSASLDTTKSLLYQSMRYKHTSVLWEHFVYLFAGAPRSEEKILGDIMRLDLHTHQWECVCPVGPCPCPRWLHSACVVGNEMIIHGGTDNDGNDLDDTWHLSLHEPLGLHRWTEYASSGQPRCAHSASICAEHRIMWVLGGCLGDGYIEGLAVYDIPRHTWHNINCQIGPAPEPRSGLASLSMEGGGVFVFGGMANGEWLRDLSVMTVQDDSLENLRRSRGKYYDGADTATLGGSSHREATTDFFAEASPPAHTDYGHRALDDFLALGQRATSAVTSATTATMNSTVRTESISQPQSSTPSGPLSVSIDVPAPIKPTTEQREAVPMTSTTDAALGDLYRLLFQIGDRLDRHTAEVNARLDDMGRRLDRATENTNQRIRELHDAIYLGPRRPQFFAPT